MEEIQLFYYPEKCKFYKNKVWFLKYIILVKRVEIKNKKIKEIKN